MVLSWAVTSESVFGRYFSTQGWRRVSEEEGLLEEEDDLETEAAWRALRLKKSAMVVGWVGVRSAR